MIACKKCGELNSLNRTLCLKCGEKLDKTGPEAIQETVPPPLKRVQIRKESIAGTFLTYLFFTFLFAALCLFFYNGLIPEPVLSLSSARTLDHKILLLTKNREPYIPLNQEEINIYLEREWSRARDSITALLPSFIRLNRIFITLRDHDLTLYLHFLCKNIPVFISFSGILTAEHEEIRLLAQKSAVGALRLPLLVTHALVKPVLQECLRNKRFSLPFGVRTLELANSSLFVYTQAGTVDSSKPDLQGPIPSDLLLVQAADVCLSRDERDKAEKYFRLALLHYPGSPLKSHIQDQLKLCVRKKDEAG